MLCRLQTTMAYRGPGARLVWTGTVSAAEGRGRGLPSRAADGPGLESSPNTGHLDEARG